MKYILSLDIGNNRIESALIDQNCNVLVVTERELSAYYTLSEPSTMGAEHSKRMLTDCLMETIQRGGISFEQIEAVGIALSEDEAANSNYYQMLMVELFMPVKPIVRTTSSELATLMGNWCFEADKVQITFAKGCVVLMHAEAPVFYKKETIISSGSVLEWLKDELGLIQSYDELNMHATNVASNLGVYFVPALEGLGSPSWDSTARGLFIGLTRGAQRAHLLRAVLEGIAFQVKEVLDTMAAKQNTISQLSISGDPAKIDFLAQTLADACQLEVNRITARHTALIGTALMAGLEAGVWQSLDDVNRLAVHYQQFQPQKDLSGEYAKWLKAVQRAHGWTD